MSTENSLEHRASELLIAGDFVAAEPLYRAMLDEEPENTQLMLMLGLCRRGQGDRENALALIRQAAESPNGDDLSYYYLGLVLAEQQQRDDALEALAACISINPNHSQARTLIGSLQLQANRTDEAVQSLLAATRANPENAAAQTSLALAYLAGSNLDKAYEHAQLAVKLKPEASATQAALGKVLLAQGHSGFAEQCLENALKGNPANPELHATMAEIQRQRGDHQRAVGHFAHAARAGHGGADLLVSMSESLVRIGQSEDALKLLAKAQNERPEDDQINLLMAQLCLDRGDLDTAESLAPRLNRENPLARVLLAELAERRGNPEEAAALLADVDATGKTAVAERAALVQARLALSKGATRQAIDWLRPFSDQDTPSTNASLMVFDLLRHQGNHDQAASVIEHLLQGRPGMAPAMLAHCHRLAADVLDQQGNYAQAASHLGLTGRQPAPIMKQLVTQRDDARHQAWLAETTPGWIAPDDGLSAPLIVLGWPGSGRAPLLEALSVHDNTRLLDLDYGQYRANGLLMPSYPDAIKALSEEELRQGRANYFMSDIDQQSSAVLIEPVWWETVNLASLARFFPGAQVVVPVAELADLELMWRLSGYGDIPHLLELWHNEARLLDHFKTILPLKFIELDRATLFDHPEATLQSLCNALELEYRPAMAERLSAAIEQQGLRPSGHCRHYQRLLRSAED